jgi:hypothetical protein
MVYSHAVTSCRDCRTDFACWAAKCRFFREIRGFWADGLPSLAGSEFG